MSFLDNIIIDGYQSSCWASNSGRLVLRLLSEITDVTGAVVVTEAERKCVIYFCLAYTIETSN
jgi:hypothetical protein